MNDRPTPPPIPRRRLAALAALLLAALLPGVVLASAAPAWAHAALVSSDPADASRVDTLPREVTLEFSEEVADPAYVVVTAPDGVRVNGGDAAVDGTRVTQGLDARDLDAQAPAGTYTLAYRVVSADGHPITGEQTFEVTAATTAAPAPDQAAPDQAPTTEQTPGQQTSADGNDDANATTVGLLVAGGVVLLVLVGALLLRARRGGVA